MIQANELRIGNLVWDKETKKERLVDWVDFKIIRKETGCNHLIQSIPLTEEWLLRFGFDITEWWYNIYWTIKPEGHREYRNSMGISLKEKRTVLGSNGGIYESMNVFVQNVEYVHQLQNLYFALTQTELEIK